MKLGKPHTIKDRVGAFVAGLLVITFGVMMLVGPNFHEWGGTRSGYDANGKLFNFVLQLIWSRPGGVIVILFGLFVGSLAFDRTKTK